MLSAMNTQLAPDDADAAPLLLWRNWYRSLIDHNTAHAGAKRAGEEWFGEGVFTSREAAESQAAVFEEIHEMLSAFDGKPLNALYLGARAVEADNA